MDWTIIYTIIYNLPLGNGSKKKKDAKRMDGQTDTLQSTGLLKTDVKSENNLVKIIHVIL